MRKLWIVSVLFLTVVPFVVRAEKVDLPPAGLRKVSTHIVVGKVLGIYERQRRAGKWMVTHYLAEVKVSAVEKGDAKAGELVYVRYWHRRWLARNAPPPSTNGHRGLPKEGETLRIYLARNAYDGFTHDNKDGGFNVIGANGFERIDGKK
jgi:hypothetical protein